ncbi:MAG: DUF2062 domain-containing protein [Alphaproteobacteria bacterium]|nr:MAG: DUF2062 domain-containing protein [Alphaproteobacteria bacterium]
MFKRNPRSWGRAALELLYPRGGWYRAALYAIHRIRRLPDPAHRISRGIAAGVFICFTPFFGLHFLGATLIAILIRGNILAALLATFVGNPLTFPLIAELSLDLGSRILGMPVNMHLPQVLEAVAFALGELVHNFLAIFTHRHAEWGELRRLAHDVFLPYTVGGLLPGLGAAMIAYGLANPLLVAYQKARVKQLKRRYEKRMAEQAARAARERAKEAAGAPENGEDKP